MFCFPFSTLEPACCFVSKSSLTFSTVNVSLSNVAVIISVNWHLKVIDLPVFASRGNVRPVKTMFSYVSNPVTTLNGVFELNNVNRSSCAVATYEPEPLTKSRTPCSIFTGESVTNPVMDNVTGKIEMLSEMFAPDSTGFCVTLAFLT